MNFSKWEKKEKIIENLKLTKFDGKKTSISGIPMCYSENNIFIDTRIVHSIVIGGKGSGKHQALIYPTIDSIAASGESALICDMGDETYTSKKELFEKNGYNVIYFDFDHAFNTSTWNPFDLASLYYKQDNYDLLEEVVDDISYYLLYKYEPNTDPFWINSVITYFKGLAIYAIKNNKEVNLNTIYLLNDEIRNNPKDFLQKLDKLSSEYVFLSSILNMPKDTLLSVLSVFDLRFNYYVVKENTKKMLSTSSIDLNKINNEKTIIFIKSGEKTISEGLLPLFISQIYNYKNNDSKFNILISNFSTYKPIQNFAKMLDYSINKGICFIMFIPSFKELEKVYGKDGIYMIEANVRNIIYLYSSDIDTIEKISRLCGMKDKDVPLISIDELKTIKEFEGIIITTRSYPFMTELLPYYLFKK